MSFTVDHALQCECEECLNRGGGVVLAVIPSVHKTELAPPIARRESKRLAELDKFSGRGWTGW